MLLVTHDLAEGYKLGSQIAIYQAGRIAQCETSRRCLLAGKRGGARLTGVRNLMDGVVSRIEPEAAWVNIPAWGVQLKTSPGKVQTRSSSTSR